jgi:hypothetical protein
MALPIEPTPVLEGEAAEELLAQLEAVCTPEEAKRRIAAARTLLEKVGLNNDDRALAGAA